MWETWHVFQYSGAWYYNKGMYIPQLRIPLCWYLYLCATVETTAYSNVSIYSNIVIYICRSKGSWPRFFLLDGCFKYRAHHVVILSQETLRNVRSNNKMKPYCFIVYILIILYECNLALRTRVLDTEVR